MRRLINWLLDRQFKKELQKEEELFKNGNEKVKLQVIRRHLSALGIDVSKFTDEELYKHITEEIPRRVRLCYDSCPTVEEASQALTMLGRKMNEVRTSIN